MARPGPVRVFARMKSTPQQVSLFLLVAALLVLAVSAGQTSKGFGQDVEKLGGKIQEKSR
jgi:predicted small secreted protein